MDQENRQGYRPRRKFHSNEERRPRVPIFVRIEEEKDSISVWDRQGQITEYRTADWVKDPSLVYELAACISMGHVRGGDFLRTRFFDDDREEGENREERSDNE